MKELVTRRYKYGNIKVKEYRIGGKLVRNVYLDGSTAILFDRKREAWFIRDGERGGLRYMMGVEHYHENF